MCPGKVEKIENDEVTVDYDGEKRIAKLVGDTKLVEGDYVFVQAKIVVQKVGKEEAEETLKELHKLK